MASEYISSWAGKKIIHEVQVDSTNEVAKRAADEGAAHGTVFWADTQTAGKGRRGRSWYSEETDNLYFTLLLRPQIAASKAVMLTLVMAYAVAEAIREETGLEVWIKWPNDIVVNGKKVCGILSEMKLQGTSMEYCVVGTGININQKYFEAELCDRATSLALEAGLAQEREKVLRRILKCFEQAYERVVEAGSLKPLQKGYNAWLINRGKQVRVLDPKGEYEGLARGITDMGELLVETQDAGLQVVYAGEVSVRGLYGYI